MLQKQPAKADHHPLLAAEKHFFQLSAEGLLQHYLSNRAEKQAEMLSADLFRQKIDGFEAVVDSEGAIHLLGYAQTGGLFYLPLSPVDPETPRLLYRDQHKKIEHLSACRDQKNNLHLLYLTRSEQYKMWWLFYLCQGPPGGQQKRTEPQVVDFGYGPAEQYGLIGADGLDQIFILYRLYRAGKYSLAFRLLTGTPLRPGETVFFAGEKEECFLPSFYVDPENALHLAWLSQQEKKMHLNYICRKPSGKWENPLKLEVPPDTFFLTSLFRHQENLFLGWKKERTLFHLYALPGGKNWRWGKKQIADEEILLLRLRPPNEPAENLPGRGYSLFTIIGDSPHKKIPQIPEIIPGDLTAEKIEKDEISTELHLLDILSAYTLTRASNLQTANNHLKQKLEQQGKELYKLHLASLAQKESLAEKIAVKNLELENIEKLAQQTFAKLQKRLQQQKEEIVTLEAKCVALQKEKEELKKERFVQATNVSRFQEEIKQLTREIEALQAERVKKAPFFSGLLRKIRR